MYYIDKMRTVIENLFTKCTNFYYKSEEEDRRQKLLEIERLWEL